MFDAIKRNSQRFVNCLKRVIKSSFIVRLKWYSENIFNLSLIPKKVSKKINIYYTWNYNAKNMEVLDTKNINLKEQEKIAFERLPGAFIRDIPRVIINRKKFKVFIAKFLC